MKMKMKVVFKQNVIANGKQKSNSKEEEEIHSFLLWSECFTFCRKMACSFLFCDHKGILLLMDFCLEACLWSIANSSRSTAPFRITFDGHPLTALKLPPTDGLPLLDVSNEDSLQKHFQIENVLMFSHFKLFLFMFQKSLNALLCPFKWGKKYIYIPTLPMTSSWLHSQYNTFFWLDFQHILCKWSQWWKKEFTCVDLDKRIVQLCPEYEIPSLPQSQQEKLIDDLSEFSMREIDVMDSSH